MAQERLEWCLLSQADRRRVSRCAEGAAESGAGSRAPPRNPEAARTQVGQRTGLMGACRTRWNVGKLAAA